VGSSIVAALRNTCTTQALLARSSLAQGVWLDDRSRSNQTLRKDRDAKAGSVQLHHRSCASWAACHEGREATARDVQVTVQTRKEAVQHILLSGCGVHPTRWGWQPAVHRPQARGGQYYGHVGMPGRVCRWWAADSNNAPCWQHLLRASCTLGCVAN
jgi:hypothetical protein